MQSIEYINYIASILSDKYSTGMSGSCGVSGICGTSGSCGVSGIYGTNGYCGTSSSKIGINNFYETYIISSGITHKEEILSILEIHEIFPFGFSNKIKTKNSDIFKNNTNFITRYE